MPKQAYFARIDEVNLQGPVLRAVIETNPSALDLAAELDYERLLYGPRSALHGIPVLVKDNIGTIALEGTCEILCMLVADHFVLDRRHEHYCRELYSLEFNHFRGCWRRQEIASSRCYHPR
jgi:hypothetical protein